MPTENIMHPCTICEKQTVHIQKRINHILHLLLSVLFLGLWLIVWIFITLFGNRTPVCTICGNLPDNNIPQGNKEITQDDRKDFYKFILICLAGMGGLFVYITKLWEKVPFLKDIIN
jgi:hypothetical protein